MKNDIENSKAKYEIIEREEDDNTSTGTYSTLDEALEKLMDNLLITLVYEAQLTNNAYLFEIENDMIGVSVTCLYVGDTKITAEGDYQIEISHDDMVWNEKFQTKFSSLRACLQEASAMIRESITTKIPVTFDVAIEQTEICYVSTLNG